MNNLYRIKIGCKITYSQKETDVVDYKTATKENKKLLISFIRSHYSNQNLREIVSGNYKAIIKDGYLVGVQYKLGAEPNFRSAQN